MKIAIVVSHPIQHFCPQYASFANHPVVKIKVFFGSALGFKPYVDPLFKQEISWSNLGLENFDHVFLNQGKVLPSDSDLDAPELDSELDKFDPSLVITYGYWQPLQRRAKQWALRNNRKLAFVSDTIKKSWWKDRLRYPKVWLYFRA